MKCLIESNVYATPCSDPRGALAAVLVLDTAEHVAAWCARDAEIPRMCAGSGPRDVTCKDSEEKRQKTTVNACVEIILGLTRRDAPVAHLMYSGPLSSSRFSQPGGRAWTREKGKKRKSEMGKKGVSSM